MADDIWLGPFIRFKRVNGGRVFIICNGGVSKTGSRLWDEVPRTRRAWCLLAMTIMVQGQVEECLEAFSRLWDGEELLLWWASHEALRRRRTALALAPETFTPQEIQLARRLEVKWRHAMEERRRRRLEEGDV